MKGSVAVKGGYDGLPWEYVRTRGGRFIHQKGCPKLRHSTKAHDWTWAKGRCPEWIDACLDWNHVEAHWCSVCCPRGAALIDGNVSG